MRARSRATASQSAFECVSVRTRCSRRVLKDEFYTSIGNNYQGEFQTAQQSWVQPGSEVLSRIAFQHMHTEPFLRASAWLDACNHTAILASQKDAHAKECLSNEEFPFSSGTTGLAKGQKQ